MAVMRMSVCQQSPDEYTCFSITQCEFLGQILLFFE
jgi:hypothetical protein